MLFPFNQQQSVLVRNRETIGLGRAMEGGLYQFISAIRKPHPESIKSLKRE